MEAYLAEKGGSMDKPIVVTGSKHIHQTNPTAPAKEDKIEAAKIRMEANLAKKEGLKKPVISIAKSGDEAPAELTEASKDDSVLDPTASSTSNLDTTTAADSSNCSSKKDHRGQISPAENDEIGAARIRMEAYLAKKIG